MRSLSVLDYIGKAIIVANPNPVCFRQYPPPALTLLQIIRVFISVP